MRLRITVSFLFLLLPGILLAQKLTNADYAEYIKKYKQAAIREMQLYKIPASITLAQGMIESGCGKSVLAVNTQNHFGIKCQKEWTGDTYYYDDDEKNECFRKYNSVEESYRDHSLFLTTRKRYAALFTLPLNDYKGWAFGLKQAGYATNPEYPNILIRLIETNQLYLLDDTLAVAANNEPQEKARVSTPEKTVTSHKKKPAVKGATYDANHELNQAINNDKNAITNEGRIIFRKNYTMPAPSAYNVSYTTEKGRKVYENAGVPFIFAKKDDTWYTIAKEFRMMIFRVYTLNDLRDSDKIVPGQMIYLKAKKKKNDEETYKVKKGDSMYSIAQEKCIKLPLLLKYNNLQLGEEPAPGYVLKLAK
jgi:LysM repeat protein